MSEDRHTLMNEAVMKAADIMEAKMAFNECVATQLETKGKDIETVRILRKKNECIKKAIELMRVNEGCWA